MLSQTVKKPRRVCRFSGKKTKSFSAGACTWQKILLRLQVWNLSAKGRQIMRAADCKKLEKKPAGVFLQAKREDFVLPFLFDYFSVMPAQATAETLLPATLS